MAAVVTLVLLGLQTQAAVAVVAQVLLQQTAVLVVQVSV
jgi:hypothetical protein